MDYVGGTGAAQTATLASSIESLNAAIQGLQGTMAAFATNLSRSAAGVIGGTGGFISNFSNVVVPVMPPRIEQITPGIFQQETPGFFHNVLAGAGIVGPPRSVMGFRPSPAYAQEARQRATDTISAFGRGVYESFADYSGLTGLADIAALGGIALNFPMAWLGGLAAATAQVGAYGYELYTGEALWSDKGDIGKHIQGVRSLYRAQREEKAASVLKGERLNYVDLGKYRTLMAEAVEEVSDEMGYKSGWFGSRSRRVTENDLLDSLEASGVQSSILRDGGQSLSRDPQKFKEALKEKSKEVVKLAEELDLSLTEAWQYLDKINSFTGHKRGADQATTVKNFFKEINQASLPLGLAPTQALDYISQMQGMYYQTGTLSPNTWGQVGKAALQNAGAIYTARGGEGSQEELINTSMSAVSKAAVYLSTPSSKGGMAEQLTRALAGRGDEGVAAAIELFGIIGDARRAGTVGTEEYNTKLQEWMKRNYNEEAIAKGYARSAGEFLASYDKIESLSRQNPFDTNLLNEAAQRMFAAALKDDPHRTIQLAIETQKYEIARRQGLSYVDLPKAEKDQIDQRAYQEFADMSGMTATEMAALIETPAKAEARARIARRAAMAVNLQRISDTFGFKESLQDAVKYNTPAYINNVVSNFDKLDMYDMDVNRWIKEGPERAIHLLSLSNRQVESPKFYKGIMELSPEYKVELKKAISGIDPSSPVTRLMDEVKSGAPGWFSSGFDIGDLSTYAVANKKLGFDYFVDNALIIQDAMSKVGKGNISGYNFATSAMELGYIEKGDLNSFKNVEASADRNIDNLTKIEDILSSTEYKNTYSALEKIQRSAPDQFSGLMQGAGLVPSTNVQKDLISLTSYMISNSPGIRTDLIRAQASDMVMASLAAMPSELTSVLRDYNFASTASGFIANDFERVWKSIAGDSIRSFDSLHGESFEKLTKSSDNVTKLMTAALVQGDLLGGAEGSYSTSEQRTFATLGDFLKNAQTQFGVDKDFIEDFMSRTRGRFNVDAAMDINMAKALTKELLAFGAPRVGVDQVMATAASKSSLSAETAGAIKEIQSAFYYLGLAINAALNGR